jgi:hypothetical protein
MMMAPESADFDEIFFFPLLSMVLGIYVHICLALKLLARIKATGATRLHVHTRCALMKENAYIQRTEVHPTQPTLSSSSPRAQRAIVYRDSSLRNSQNELTINSTALCYKTDPHKPGASPLNLRSSQSILWSSPERHASATTENASETTKNTIRLTYV